MLHGGICIHCASSLMLFLTRLSVSKSWVKLPTLNSPLPALTSLIISLHNTPSGPEFKRRCGAAQRVARGVVEGIQLSVNLAQAREPLTPQPSCYQLTLTPTQSDAIILLQRLY